MELIKHTINSCKTAVKSTTQAMTEGDIIVPDTKPDILKLLQVDSDACITDKYIENGRLILCGRVDYKILYIPDGENQKIKSILSSMEFKQIVDANKADDLSQILAKAVVERVEFNTVNSRKLRLRAIIRIDYELCTLAAAEISCDIDGESVEKKISTICFESATNISEHEFTIREKLEVPNGGCSISEILKSDVKIYDTEYKSVTGKVIIKGTAVICVLYTDENNEIKFIEAESPFTEVLDAEGVTEASICDIDYSIIGVMCKAEPDIDGDLRDIALDIDICASLKATESVEQDFLSDCYIPYKITECDKSTINLITTIERPVALNTLRDIIEIPATAPGVTGIYNIMTNSVITKSELERNKIICEGKVETYILYLTDSPENPIYSLKKDIPFSYMIECKNETTESKCELKSSIKHASYSLNSGGEIEVRCLLSIECMLLKELFIENIEDVRDDESVKQNGIVIYFAEKGENVWEIGKRYGIPCNTLREHNNLDDDILENDCKLFIPMN